MLASEMGRAGAGIAEEIGRKVEREAIVTYIRRRAIKLEGTAGDDKVDLLDDMVRDIEQGMHK